MKSPKRWVITWGAILLLGLGAAFLILSRDEAPPAVLDLVATRQPLAAESNAFTYFSIATNALRWPVSDAFLGPQGEGALVQCSTNIQDLLAENVAVLALIRQGNQCGQYQAPEIRDFITLLPHTAYYRRYAKLLAAQAADARQRGDAGAAVNACRDLLQFGDLCYRNPESFIEYLLGAAVLHIGLAEVRHLLDANVAGESELAVLDLTLQKLSDGHAGVARAMAVELRCSTVVIDGLANGRNLMLGDVDFGQIRWPKSYPGFLFKPNATKRIMADNYRQVIASCAMPLSQVNFAFPAPCISRQRIPLRTLVRPNAVGRLLGSSLVPSLVRAAESRCRLEACVSGARLAVACRRYERAHGAFPGSLEALVPDYLPAVPRDPYDGAPFRYAPALGLAYAVGLNFRDDGGSDVCDDARASGEQRRWWARDVVFPVGAPKSNSEGT